MSAGVPSRRSALIVRLLGATALAYASVAGLAIVAAHAQDLGSLGETTPGAEMLLEADTLIYDRDANTVAADGSVQIEYDGNKLVAQRVTYDRSTSRLIAHGDVQIVYRDGTKIFADEFDITDDFADGFINALRVETVDKTYFAAESAERKGGVLTTFNNGVYTACEPCEEDPDKAPIWRIKSQKIIWNGKAKTVRFERPRFELFGLPIAALPAFEIADPTVKRKSGFLFPGVTYNTEKGVGVTVPFFWSLSPTYDLTFRPRYYSKQGFLGEVEWRQAFNSGQYNLKVAGIRQNDPGSFVEGNYYTVDSGPRDDPNRERYMIGSKGDFIINPRWRFGWDLLWQSDKNFSRSYAITDFDDPVKVSQIYLTGLNDRNYFDLRGMYFHVQEEYLDSHGAARNDKQPWVLPSLDYSFTPDEPVFGGELNIDMNARVIKRDELDIARERIAPGAPLEIYKVPGAEGDSSRLTAEAEWKRSLVTDGGLVVSPLLHFRSDASFVNYDANSRAAIEAMAAHLNLSPDYTGGPVDAEVRSSYYRYMATAGLELRWPLLFSSSSSTHVLEPTAQVFVRPNAGYSDVLGLPNEDAQSLVFDASTLFERDKFSGYDGMEGGSRANVGMRYTGSYGNGWTTNALFGQSYHLGGDNPFNSPDLVNVGAYSGLETDRSDFVGLVGFSSPFGLSASLAARFDERTFEVRRTDTRALLSRPGYAISARYAFIQAQPLYGFTADRHDVTVGASLNLNENWRLFGSATYDFGSDKFVSDSIGFAYADECFTYLMAMSETRNRITDEVSRNVSFNLTFRTLGDFGSNTGDVVSSF